MTSHIPEFQIEVVIILKLLVIFQISGDVTNLDEKFDEEVTTVLANCGLPMKLTVRIVSSVFISFSFYKTTSSS